MLIYKQKYPVNYNLVHCYQYIIIFYRYQSKHNIYNLTYEYIESYDYENNETSHRCGIRQSIKQLPIDIVYGHWLPLRYNAALRTNRSDKDINRP